jgi:hypothetical protein
MTVLCLAACLLALQEQEAKGDREHLDPSVFGITIEFPADWERHPDESLQYRLAYMPKKLEGTDPHGRSLYARIVLSRLKEGGIPIDEAGWERWREEVLRGFRHAFPKAVRVESFEKLKIAGQDGFTMELQLEETGTLKRTARTVLFFAAGYAWRLDLVASPEVFEKMLPAYEATRGSIKLEEGISGLVLPIVIAVIMVAILIIVAARRKSGEAAEEA